MWYTYIGKTQTLHRIHPQDIIRNMFCGEHLWTTFSTGYVLHRINERHMFSTGYRTCNPQNKQCYPQDIKCSPQYITHRIYVFHRINPEWTPRMDINCCPQDIMYILWIPHRTWIWSCGQQFLSCGRHWVYLVDNTKNISCGVYPVEHSKIISCGQHDWHPQDIVKAVHRIQYGLHRTSPTG